MGVSKNKLIRITTVPLSLDLLLSGQLNYINSFYDVTAVASEEEYLKKIGVKESVKTFTIEMSRKITPIKDIVSVVKLFFFLKREKPLIVHSHTPKAGILTMVASKCAGVPIRLHTVAGLPLMEAKGLKRNLLEGVEKLTYNCATRVYPNSKGLYDFILDNKFTDHRKLKIIGNGSSNGIDTNYFSPEQVSQTQKNSLKIELGIKEEDFVYVFVGRLVGDKGINEVVAAFKNLVQKNLNIKLLLVGMYEQNLDPLNSFTHKEISKNKNIIFADYQNDIRPYLAISKALIFASYREGFPNVVLQAGAMGLPSIVTNINGCNEIITDGKNGIIIPVKNSEVIERAVLKMIIEKDFFASLQSNAREMITSRYEQKVIWNAILDEYRQIEEKQQNLIDTSRNIKGIKLWETKLIFDNLYRYKNKYFTLNNKIIYKNNRKLLKPNNINTINVEANENHFIDNRKLYIFGASDYGKEIKSLVAKTNCKLEALFDDLPKRDKLGLIPVYNSNEIIKPSSDVALIIAIENNQTRKNISLRFSEYNFFSCIDKSAYISPTATVGIGTVVMLRAIINADAKIGNHVIINTAAIIEHDCIIDDFVHISPNVTLSGNISIGSGSHLGSGAIVVPGVKIGKWCTIAAGTVVINDIPDGATVVGNPGKIISYKNITETSISDEKEKVYKKKKVIKINREKLEYNVYQV